MVRFKKGSILSHQVLCHIRATFTQSFFCVSPPETMKFVIYIMFYFNIKWKALFKCKSISMEQRKGEGSKDNSHMTKRLFKILKDNLRYQRASIFTCKFSVVRFIRHCFHVGIFVLKWGHFLKKSSQKFTGLWWPNHSIYMNLWKV